MNIIDDMRYQFMRLNGFAALTFQIMKQQREYLMTKPPLSVCKRMLFRQLQVLRANVIPLHMSFFSLRTKDGEWTAVEQQIASQVLEEILNQIQALMLELDSAVEVWESSPPCDAWQLEQEYADFQWRMIQWKTDLLRHGLEKSVLGELQTFLQVVCDVVIALLLQTQKDRWSAAEQQACLRLAERILEMGQVCLTRIASA